VGDCPSLTPQPATTAIAQPLVPVATSTAQPVTPASGPSEAPAQGSHDVLGRFALQQGQTITNTVTVTSGCPDLVVSVNWQSGEVSTVMTSPSGRQITASTQAADVTQNGDPTWQYYMVSFPEIGVWNILTTGVSVEPGGETINVNVDAMPPIPPEVLAFANQYSGSAPLKVAFSSSANDLEGGTITSYTWDFGDGSSGTGPTPTHTYARAGSYVATVTVTSSEGEEASASTSQIVVGPAGA
jgi:PKD repeat protein